MDNTYISSVFFLLYAYRKKFFSDGKHKIYFWRYKTILYCCNSLFGFYILFDVAITLLYVYINEKSEEKEKSIKIKWIEEHYFAFSFYVCYYAGVLISYVICQDQYRMMVIGS